MTKDIIQRSDEMWKWIASEHKNECYTGFHEIHKFQDAIKELGYKHETELMHGGLTIICRYKNGKILAKVRENCFSEGSIMDLLEVTGLFKSERGVYSYMSTKEAISLVLGSFKNYERTLKNAV